MRAHRLITRPDFETGSGYHASLHSDLDAYRRFLFDFLPFAPCVKSNS